ncbi:MAG TPA: hypothetical protein DDY91_14700 [Planctomycetaceae bacterium]|nr:hypothetical protein [Planctomycetaceae bacterium]
MLAGGVNRRRQEDGLGGRVGAVRDAVTSEWSPWHGCVGVGPVGMLWQGYGIGFDSWEGGRWLNHAQAESLCHDGRAERSALLWPLF